MLWHNVEIFLQKNKIKPMLGTDTAGAAEDLSKKKKKIQQLSLLP